MCYLYLENIQLPLGLRFIKTFFFLKTATLRSNPFFNNKERKERLNYKIVVRASVDHFEASLQLTHFSF